MRHRTHRPWIPGRTAGVVAHVVTALALVVSAPEATAQLQLPAVPLPPVPALVPLVPTPATSLEAVDSTLRERIDARILAGRLLVRQHRDVLETDPDGAPIRRAEVLAIASSAQAAAAAQSLRFTIARRESLPELGIELVAWSTPPGMSTRRALAQLRKIDPGGTYDYNHVFLPGGEVVPHAAGRVPQVAAAPNAQAEMRATPMRIGMIDGGVDATHPDLAAVRIDSRGCDGRAVPTAHGTAVAALLALADASGRDNPEHTGVATPMSLRNVDVYCGQPTGGSIDTLAHAFEVLLQSGAQVINVSLVGPRNLPLELLVQRLVQRGILITAAVGNDGPAARPLYPAASAGVVAVTAVDARGRVLAEACRGDHVMFAARGADLLAADDHHGYQAVRGTSFAAPLVAGMLAKRLAQPGVTSAQALLQLQHLAIDLGRPGRDPVYGFGLVGSELPFRNPPSR